MSLILFEGTFFCFKIKIVKNHWGFRNMQEKIENILSNSFSKYPFEQN